MDSQTRPRKIIWRSRYPSRSRNALDEFRPEPEWKRFSGIAIAGFAALAVVVAAGVDFGSHFVRYWKICWM